MFKVIHTQRFQMRVGPFHGSTDPTQQWFGAFERGTITPVNLVSGEMLPKIQSDCPRGSSTAIAPTGKHVATLHNGKLSVVSSAGIESSTQLVARGNEGTELWDLDSCVWVENVSFLPCGHRLVATVRVGKQGLLMLVDKATLTVLDTVEVELASTSLFVSQHGTIVVSQEVGDTALGSFFYQCNSKEIRRSHKFLDPLDDNMPELYGRYQLFAFSPKGQRFVGMDFYGSLWEIDWQTWQPSADRHILSKDEENEDLLCLRGDQACYIGSAIAVAILSEEDNDAYFKIRFFSAGALEHVHDVLLPAEAVTPDLYLHPGGYITTASSHNFLDLWHIVPLAPPES